ncbi:serine/threonine-protein phosphatase 7 long form [Cinnamomum micranthum f. kanehirae]|uniref:Serine/threonine-protein phosphatase 7 long form n=1 Tax=Cinnamomum micranthum f. kanehirae TaxID=337451 RepID=A0A3S3NMY6_9MAGN|nr:serine/threonine-protein phosphatase 7 long form [Cinnamomum micranthum f. kanehirae]
MKSLDLGAAGDSNVVAEEETASGGDDAGEEDVERHLAGVFFPRTCGDQSSTCHWRGIVGGVWTTAISTQMDPSSPVNGGSSLIAELNPGPLDKSILQEQDYHISEVLWSGRKLAFIQETGLLHLSKLQKIAIDHALISALVERWRQETNTFHLASGKATVTLEDVAYIYGLPINGRVVTGRTFSSPTTVSMVCLELLGKQPQQGNDCSGSDLKLTWLVKKFRKLSKKSSKKEQIMATRAYLFCLVAGQIFTNTSGSMRGAWILELFREFKKFTWGPSCLANLYRQLTIRTVAKSTAKYKGSKRPTDHQKSFGGPVQLLQIWAISCMSIGREIKSAQQWDDHIEFPLSQMWSRRLKSHKTFSTVEVVRKQLDNQDPDNFIWRPYVGFKEELAKIVDEQEIEVFSSQTVVVCYWIVECHNSNRVMKQFGLQQIVPHPFYGAFNREDRILKATVDYSKKMKEGIKEWKDRKKSVLKGEVELDSNRHSDEYFQWYRGITRLRIGRFEVVEGNTNPDLEQENNHTQQGPGPSQSHPQTDLFDSTKMEIGDFASHLLLGVEDMKKQPDKEKKIDEFLDRIGRKIM